MIEVYFQKDFIALIKTGIPWSEKITLNVKGLLNE